MAFEFNPRFLPENQISANTVGASGNVSNAYGNLMNVLRGYQGQTNIEDAARAKVDASALGDERNVMARILANQDSQDAATKLFGREQVLQGQKTKDAKAAAKQLSTEQGIQINQRSQGEIERIREMAKLNPKTKGVDLTKTVIKSVQEAGGLDNLVSETVSKLDDQDWFVHGLNPQSRSDLKASIMQKIQEPGERERFVLDVKGYVDEIRKETGETGFEVKPWNILPGGDPLFRRTFTPNVVSNKTDGTMDSSLRKNLGLN